MQNDPGNEWTRLTRIYAEKSDEELLDLATDFGNLTDTAQSVLRDELRKRKLGTPEAANSVHAKDQPSIFGRWTEEPIASDPSLVADEVDDSIPFVYLCECDSSDQVNQLGEVLRRAGIESRAQNTSYRPVATFETCRLTVRADQLDDARAVIARPIPQDVIDEVNRPVEDFVPPTCPKCGASDPLLESIAPTNSWLCENCGARWTDPAPVENEGQNPA